MISITRFTDAEASVKAMMNSAFTHLDSEYIELEGQGERIYLKNINEYKEPTVKVSSKLQTNPKIVAVNIRAVNKEELLKLPVVCKIIINIERPEKAHLIKCDRSYAETITEIALENTPVYTGQKYAFVIGNGVVLGQIMKLFSLDSNLDEYEVTYGFTGTSSITTDITTSSRKFLLIEPEHEKLGRAFNPSNWNFESIEVGGLSQELFTILRRAFLSRLMKPQLVKKLGLRHVKGMLLYGPPGCGKTLISRKIGKLLGLQDNDSHIKIVNGPELFSKWSGEAEQRLRELFTTKDDDLHVLIFDEIESSARRRSGGDNSEITGRFVTQFLALLDGVKEQSNIFVIGMTNRMDLIDPAMLRPGRLEIHVEIKLPDVEGRKEILLIHTKCLREGNMLDLNVDLDDIASRSVNYTGAEIEGLVKSAVSFATTRESKLSDITETESVIVTKEDFDKALSEVHPAFGNHDVDLDRYIRYGIDTTIPGLDPESAVDYLLGLPEDFSEIVVISGLSGCGCSTWAATIAKDTGKEYGFIRFISPYKYVEFTEQDTLKEIGQIFRDAYKSKSSLIIIDDIERLLRMVNNSFSHFLYAGLLTLIREPPPVGKKLVIVLTTHSPELIHSMNLTIGTEYILPDHPSGVSIKKYCKDLIVKD
jgi:SpoVK/Ycf46/Vps4 family AAA+-type ATPase